MTEKGDADYILGTHDHEVARLGLQHRVWRPVVTACWQRVGITHGWRVLDGLKIDLATRHIPVHVITVDEDSEPARTGAAVGFLTKSETKESLQMAFERQGPDASVNATPNLI